MSIWKKNTTPEQLTEFSKNCLVGHLGITFSEIGDDYLSATMPVVAHNTQPLGFLHGGASVVLAETLGSVAAYLTCEEGKNAFGVEVNANHLKAMRNGIVTGVAKPLRLGKSLQVWEIHISNEIMELICVSRLTVAIR